MIMIIDPFLISIPSEQDFGTKDVIEYVERLQMWEREFVCNSDKYIVSHAALSKMQEVGISPTHDNLSAFWKKHGISEVSYQDIAPTCAGLMINSNRLEDVTMYTDILSEVELIDGKESIIPEEIRKRMHPNVAEEFIHSLIYSAYSLKVINKENGWSIVTAPLDTPCIDSTLITKASMSKIQNDGSLTSFDISYSWPLLFSPEHIYASLNIAEIYHQLSLQKVVEVAWCRLNNQSHTMQRIDYSKLCFQDKFLESIDDPRILKRPTFKDDIRRVFEAIVFSVLNIWSFGCDKHHILREVINLRTSKEQTRLSHIDPNIKDSAARIEVIGGSRPLHIHYWRRADGKFEFSNLTDEHDDPTIYK